MKALNTAKKSSKEPSTAWRIGFCSMFFPACIVGFPLLLVGLWVIAPVLTFLILGFLIYIVVKHVG